MRGIPVHVWVIFKDPVRILTAQKQPAGLFKGVNLSLSVLDMEEGRL